MLLLALIVCGMAHPSAQIRGPLWLLGKTPDRNPYGCTASTTGTYVGPAASITDAGCAVWTLGAGTTPNIAILRNGSQACGAFGAQIEWFSSNLYVQGDDLSWYLWNGSCFDLFGASDPSGGGATPTGYFVATTGDDSRSCMTAATITTPKKTITSGAACLAAGDTLYVRGGTYTESLANPATTSGTDWNNVVRIMAYPGETPIVRPSATPDYALLMSTTHSYVVFDGLTFDGANAVAGVIKIEAVDTTTHNPHHIRIIRATVIGNTAQPQQGIVIDAQADGTTGSDEIVATTIRDIGGDDFSHGIYTKSPATLVDGCDISNFPGAGIQLFSGHAMSGAVLRNNTIHAPRHGGTNQRHWGIVWADGTASGLAYNNVIYDITLAPGASSVSFGIQVYDNSGIGLYNNTITNVSGYGINLDVSSSGLAARNNIAFSNFVDITDGSGATKTNNLTADPLFVNAAAHNYQIQAGSAARDVATALASFFTTDLLGVPRPQGPAWDIGAYEYH